MSFILADACVVTVNSANDVYEGGSVLVRDDRIAGIGSKAELTSKNPDAEVIDCGSNILMPGMVNTHTHLFQTLLKGPGDDMVLKDWFTCMTGPAAVELTVADVHAAAMHGCVESIRSGVTTLVEFMYARSEERRVGKECRSRWSPYQLLKKEDRKSTRLNSSHTLASRMPSSA